MVRIQAHDVADGTADGRPLPQAQQACLRPGKGLQLPGAPHGVEMFYLPFYGVSILAFYGEYFTM